jgi:predicted dehydrogenase
VERDTPIVSRRTPLRATICGAGAAGCMHALTFRAAGVSVVGIFDPDLTKAHALAELCGARAVTNLEALFAIESELTSVCSPPPVHVDQAEGACRRDRIVFVEKPVATTAEDLERVACLGWCVPVLQWRAGRALRAVRAAIRSGELGDAPSVDCDLAWSRDSAYFEAGRATRSAWGGGVLLSVAIHAIDAVCFALGRRVTSASGALAHRVGVDVETSAVMTMGFEGGALAATRATFDSSEDATRLSFVGREVAAIIEGTEVDPTAGRVLWQARDPARLRRLQAIEAGCAGALTAPLLVPFLHDAIEAVRRGAAPGECDTLPSVESTREPHAAIFATYRADG